MLKRTENFEHYERLSAELKAIFAEDGWMTQNDLRINSVQSAYASAVVETLTQQGFNDALGDHAAIRFLEADTGVGKSLGYLIPISLYVALTGRRAAISTFTRTLQRQLLQDTWPKANKLLQDRLGRALKIALRMGRRNFLCEGAINKELLQASKSRAKSKIEAVQCLTAMSQWLASPATSGLVFDFLEDYGIEELPAELRRLSLFPTDKRAPGFGRYAKHVADSQEADIIITNHAVTVLNALTRQRLLQIDGAEPVSVWMVDEADRLRAAAESIVQNGVALQRLHYLLKFLQGYAPALIGEDEVADAFTLFDTLVQAYPGESTLLEKMPQAVFEAVAHAHETLQPTSLAVARWLDDTSVGQIDLDVRDAALELIESLECFNEFVESAKAARRAEPHFKVTLVSWSEKKHWPSLIFGSTNPGYIMNRYFKRSEGSADGVRAPQAIMFTSATLSSFQPKSARRRPHGALNMKDIEIELGVFHETPGVLPPPDRFAPKNFGGLEAITLADRRVPKPYYGSEQEDDGEIEPNEEWVSYANLMIQRAANAKLGKDQTGRTLVLCASFADTARFGRLAKEALGDRVIVHRKGESLRSCLKAFLAQPDSVLVTPSAWEGLDLPNAIRHVVVPRLPYESPASTSKIIESAFLKSRYEPDYVNTIKTVRRRNRVLSKLKQGFGRGIRHPEDCIAFWIADPRVSFPHAIKLDIMRPKIREMDHSAHFSCKKDSLNIEDMFPKRFSHMLDAAFVLSQDDELIGFDHE